VRRSCGYSRSGGRALPLGTDLQLVHERQTDDEFVTIDMNDQQQRDEKPDCSEPRYRIEANRAARVVLSRPFLPGERSTAIGAAIWRE